MKIGVWIPTCWGYRFRERLWRQVCLPRCEAVGWQVIFYDEGEPDEIYHFRAGARQGSYNLAAKVRTMCRLALEHGFDYMVRCDTDTELWPERFVTKYDCGYIPFFEGRAWDYIGNHVSAPLSEPFPFHYASGMCYILSRHMMSLVSKSSTTYRIGHNIIDREEWAEDRFVGRVAHDNHIPLILEPRIVFNQHYRAGEWLAWHDFGKVVGQKKGCPHLAENEPYGAY